MALVLVVLGVLAVLLLLEQALREVWRKDYGDDDDPEEKP